mmetsp:Transcript_60196/g.160130  ORF Transcript_60196/g.160130 Transcript_60196/m.160130 type:complete len:609 (-) Transcript_60196:279-2105(-)
MILNLNLQFALLQDVFLLQHLKIAGSAGGLQRVQHALDVLTPRPFSIVGKALIIPTRPFARVLANFPHARYFSLVIAIAYLFTPAVFSIASSTVRSKFGPLALDPVISSTIIFFACVQVGTVDLTGMYYSARSVMRLAALASGMLGIFISTSVIFQGFISSALPPPSNAAGRHMTPASDDSAQPLLVCAMVGLVRACSRIVLAARIGCGWPEGRTWDALAYNLQTSAFSLLIQFLILMFGGASSFYAPFVFALAAMADIGAAWGSSWMSRRRAGAARGLEEVVGRDRSRFDAWYHDTFLPAAQATIDLEDRPTPLERVLVAAAKANSVALAARKVSRGELILCQRARDGGDPVGSLDQVYAQAQAADLLLRSKLEIWAASCGGILTLRPSGSFSSTLGGLSDPHCLSGMTNCTRLGSACDMAADGKPVQRHDGDEWARWDTIDPSSPCRSRVAWARLKGLDRAAVKAASGPVPWGSEERLSLVRGAIGAVFGSDGSRNVSDPSLLLDVCRQRLIFDDAVTIASCLETIISDPEVWVERVRDRLDPSYDGMRTCGYRDVQLKLRVVSEEARRLGVDGHVCEVLLVPRGVAELMSADTHRRFLQFRNSRY